MLASSSSSFVFRLQASSAAATPLTTWSRSDDGRQCAPWKGRVGQSLCSRPRSHGFGLVENEDSGARYWQPESFEGFRFLGRGEVQTPQFGELQARDSFAMQKGLLMLGGFEASEQIEGLDLLAASKKHKAVLTMAQRGRLSTCCASNAPSDSEHSPNWRILPSHALHETATL